MNGLEIAMRNLYLLYTISVSLIYPKTIYVNLPCEQIREYETVGMKHTIENHTYNGKIEAVNPNGLEVKISYGCIHHTKYRKNALKNHMA